MRLGWRGFVEISALGVVILVKDQRQIIVGFLHEPPVCGDHRQRAIPVATVQIPTLRVGSFVVNESPRVEAGKNPEIQAAREVRIPFDPLEHGFGGSRFVAVNSRREINRRRIGRRFFGKEVEERIAVGFRENLQSQTRFWRGGAPAFHQMRVVVAARVAKRGGLLEFSHPF